MADGTPKTYVRGRRLNRLASSSGILGQTAGAAVTLTVLVVLTDRTRPPVVPSAKTSAELLAVTILIVAVVAGAYILWRRRRKTAPESMPGEVSLTPPDGVSPAMAAWLLGGGDKRVMLTLVVDLVMRKVIAVSPSEPGMLSWEPNAGGSPLLSHEQTFLQQAFGHEKASLTLPRDEQQMRHAMGETALLQDMVKLGLARLTKPADLVNFLVGFVAAMFFFLGVRTIRYGVGVAILAGVVTFFVVQFHGSVYELSATGQLAAQQAMAFGRYLDTAEVEQLQWEANNSIVAGYVPWAFALGRLKLWERWQRSQSESANDQSGDMALLFDYLFSLARDDALPAWW